MAVSDYAYIITQMFGDIRQKDIRIDELSSSFAFVGYAKSGSATSASVWRIARVFRQGNQYTIEHAANGLANQIWNDRVSLFSSGSLGNSYSISFDGVNDTIDFGNNYTFEISQAFSIGFWVKPNNLAATRCLVSKCSNDANVYGYNIQHLITSGVIQLQMRSSGGTFPLFAFNSTSALVAGSWQHIVITYSGGSNINGARCYRNASVADTPSSSALSGSFSNTASFVLGARNTAFPFSGNIDEVTVWNKALSAAEVSELYNSGQPADLTAHSAFANLQSWWRMGDDDTYPTILDNVGSVNGTMTNMTSGDIVGDVP